jgi:hypothetical protein
VPSIVHISACLKYLLGYISFWFVRTVILVNVNVILCAKYVICEVMSREVWHLEGHLDLSLCKMCHLSVGTCVGSAADLLVLAATGPY